MNPVIVTAAGTGGKWTKEDSEYVPMTPEQIVDDAVKAFEAGAAMFHIHARTEDGTPTFEPVYFERMMGAMRKKCPGVVIQMSTGFMEGKVAEKLEPLMKLRPDLASFNLKSTDREIELMAEIMNKYNVRPAIECFTMEMLNKAKELMERGLLKAPLFAECVFNLEETDESFVSKAEHLIMLAKNFPEGTVWSQTRGAFDQAGLQAMTVCLGGNVRTGLEDNLFSERGIYAKSSRELIEKATKIIEGMGRKVATAVETRKILGFK